jgi:hypothetical protein
MLSDAEAEKVITLETVAPPPGSVSETAGATMSTEDESAAGLPPESAQESRLRLQTARAKKYSRARICHIGESNEQVICHHLGKKT